MSDDNIFRFGTVKGGKSDDDDGIPINDYVIEDTDNVKWFETGFLVFTPQHVAVMRDEGQGAIPVLVIPLSRVKAAGLSEEIEEEESPF